MAKNEIMKGEKMTGNMELFEELAEMYREEDVVGAPETPSFLKMLSLQFTEAEARLDQLRSSRPRVRRAPRHVPGQGRQSRGRHLPRACGVVRPAALRGSRGGRKGVHGGLRPDR